jgi:hypothetical protein
MLIVATGGMADVDFLHHLNLRHVPCGDWANLRYLDAYKFAEDRKLYETYHNYLHRTYDYDHSHARPKKSARTTQG